MNSSIWYPTMERSRRRPSPLCYNEEKMIEETLRYPPPPPMPPPFDVYSSTASCRSSIESRRIEDDPEDRHFNWTFPHEDRRYYDDEYHYDDDIYHQDHFRQRRNDDYGPRNYSQERWLRGKQEKDTVEFVHHQSPIGPAVSVYPKDYLRNRQALERRTVIPQTSSSSGTTRRLNPMEAETAKIAAFDAEMNRAKASRNSSYSPPPMVEIAPGVHLRLRGAAETLECVRKDFIVPSMCFSCDLEQFCIQDASCVLCPRCRVVNPVSGFHGINKDSDVGNGGVALGFTMEDLRSMQMEFLRAERNGCFY